VNNAKIENTEIIYPDEDDLVVVDVYYTVNFVKCLVLIYAFPLTKP